MIMIMIMTLFWGSVLASAPERARFAEAAQVGITPNTISISFAEAAKISSSDVKQFHEEEEEENVQLHGLGIGGLGDDGLGSGGFGPFLVVRS